MLGVAEDWWRRLSVNLVWGRSRSRRYPGKAGGRLVMMARKWDLIFEWRAWRHCNNEHLEGQAGNMLSACPQWWP
jgi:hypothetical protein